jgi:hypothetical protein
MVDLGGWLRGAFNQVVNAVKGGINVITNLITGAHDKAKSDVIKTEDTAKTWVTSQVHTVEDKEKEIEEVSKAAIDQMNNYIERSLQETGKAGLDLGSLGAMTYYNTMVKNEEARHDEATRAVAYEVQQKEKELEQKIQTVPTEELDKVRKEIENLRKAVESVEREAEEKARQAGLQTRQELMMELEDLMGRLESANTLYAQAQVQSAMIIAAKLDDLFSVDMKTAMKEMMKAMEEIESEKLEEMLKRIDEKTAGMVVKTEEGG